MFHKAIKVTFKNGTLLEVLFQNGETKQFDMASLFEKYPQLEALNKRSLFVSGKLISPYGIVWNDELDIETETIYEAGITVKTNQQISATILAVAEQIRRARANAGISQKILSEKTGINQADISKIERGLANPSLLTIERISSALNSQLSISISAPN